MLPDRPEDMEATFKSKDGKCVRTAKRDEATATAAAAARASLLTNTAEFESLAGYAHPSLKPKTNVGSCGDICIWEGKKATFDQAVASAAQDTCLAGVHKGIQDKKDSMGPGSVSGYTVRP